MTTQDDTLQDDMTAQMAGNAALGKEAADALAELRAVAGAVNDAIDSLSDREFSINGFDFEVRKIPYSQGRPIFDIFRCATPHMQKVALESSSFAVGSVFGLMSMLSAQDVTEIERSLYKHVFVSVPGAHGKLELAARVDEVFDGNVGFGYEVLVRTFCASFLGQLKESIINLLAGRLISSQ